MTDILLQKVLAKLDLLCLEYHSDGYFSCIGEPPVWAVELFSCIRNRFPRILPMDISSFLDNFMVDAVEFWQSGSANILRSGYWTEASSAFAGSIGDRVPSQDVNLEALVLSVDERHLLLLEVSDAKFDQTFQWLQLARVERLDSLVERKENASQMTSLTLFDSLTGCANEQALTIQLAQWLEQLRQGFISQFVILKLNVDRFRHLNFMLGVAAGDQCLMQIAQRLKAYVGVQDLVARLGADEFALLVRLPSGVSQAAWMKQLMTHLRSPYRLGARQINITLSCGLCSVQNQDWEVEKCLLNAAFALNQAKEIGRGQYVVFESERYFATLNQLKQEQQLLQAIEKKALLATFRPLFAATTRQVIGFEPILNWPVAEQAPLMTVESVGQSAHLELELATYGCCMGTQVFGARPSPYPLLLLLPVPLAALLDVSFQAAIADLHALMQPGDQLVLQPPLASMMTPMQWAQVLPLCQSLKLKLCVNDSGLSRLRGNEALMKAIGYVSTRLDISMPSLTVQELSHLSQWQGNTTDIMLIGQHIVDEKAYQRAIAAKHLNIYAGDYLAEPLPLNAFMQLLQLHS